MAEPLISRLDRLCYETFIVLIGIVAFICGYLISWASFLLGLGCFIRLQFKEGFLALLIFLLSIVIWRGFSRLYEKLEKNDKLASDFPTEEELELYKDDLEKIEKKYRGEEAFIKVIEFIEKKRKKILNNFKRLNK